MSKGKKKNVCKFHKIINQRFSKTEAHFFLSNPMYAHAICSSCREVLSKILLGRLLDAKTEETGQTNG